ncbi:hypothetical protein F4779DRAFT_421371 [Xylariaceae sp. FL0662B]|nr:hypothetical protein F4779DRAFT_421371 [Xylariaceae sp. FL0662B]
MDHPKPATKPRLPPFSSPSDLLGNTHIQRHFVNIAKDQLELLDRPDSWASILRRRPNGFVNVPPDVLRSLKESHARKLHPAQSEKTPASSSPGVNGNGVDEQKSEGGQSEGFQSQPEADEDDDNGTVITDWSASPERNLQPLRTTSEEVEQQFLTQIPQKSPPQPTVPASAKRPVFNDLPSSSLGQEDELELEVPNAIGDSVLPINKPDVQITATPPSAQVVPCTFEQPEQSPGQPKPKHNIPGKQRKYTGLPELYRPQKYGSAYKHLTTSMTKAKPANPPHTDVQSSISTANTSSSIIPATIHDELAYKRIPTWHGDQVSSSNKLPQPSHESFESGNSPDAKQPSPDFKPSSPHLQSSPPIRPTSRSALQSIPQESLSPPNPFTRYTVTYPSYNGSISDFVTACMYIQTQQRRLRTSLYDDFIRAWTEGYLQYVKDCDHSEPPTVALNAIEWYNEIDDDPIFTSRIVTRQNLESILNFYPDELCASRNVLGLSPNPTPEAAQAPGGTQPMKRPGPNTTSITIPDAVNPTKPGRDVAQPGTLRDDLRSPVPRAIDAAILRHRREATLPLHKSMSAVEKGPRAREGLTRSLSEAASHKRKASDSLSNAAPKRVLTTSDSASVASDHSTSIVRGSVAPSSTSERLQRYAKGPKKGGLPFKEWIKRGKHRKMDSIASSAPVSNSPTSAQKQ